MANRIQFAARDNSNTERLATISAIHTAAGADLLLTTDDGRVRTSREDLLALLRALRSTTAAAPRIFRSTASPAMP